MRVGKRILPLCALMLLAAVTGRAAELNLPSIFSDNMVLQRDRAVPVWGKGAPGEAITVSIAGKQFSGKADEQGNFRIAIGPFAVGGPYELTVAGSDSPRVFKNVMFGEVWLCGGQSNMEWTVANSKTGKEAIAGAGEYPMIRLFKAPRQPAVRPQTELQAAWQICSPETVGPFSGVGYFFGRELYRELKVPVGLILSCWSGTRIEPWTPLCGLKQLPELAALAEEVESRTGGTAAYAALTKKTEEIYTVWLQRYREAVARQDVPPAPPAFPKVFSTATRGTVAALYNGMIHPLAPYGIRGAIWYQGEANLGDGAAYYSKMEALVRGWREVFNNPDMSFYFAQLAPYDYKGDAFRLPVIWEVQQRFADTFPKAGMAVINDVGMLNDIHPKDKETVGRRLALLALKRDYGRTELAADCPAPDRIEFKGSVVEITGRHVQTWKTRDGKEPNWFELAGPDCVFHPAHVEMTGNKLLVSSDKVPEARQIRFAWNQLAEPNLTNEAGLPLGAFRAAQPVSAEELAEWVPEAGKYKMVFRCNMLAGDKNAAVAAKYDLDYSSALKGKVKRIGYLVRLEKTDGTGQYVWCAMDPFDTELRYMGVPTFSMGRKYQTFVTNLEVHSNVPGVKTGTFERGNIEFWCSNYTAPNVAKVPGASSETFDFGDAPAPVYKPGYGSMQVHNTAEKQTVFAYNRWVAGPDAEIGIGDAPTGNPDWTFSQYSKTLKSATLWVLAELE